MGRIGGIVQVGERKKFSPPEEIYLHLINRVTCIGTFST